MRLIIFILLFVTLNLSAQTGGETVNLKDYVDMQCQLNRELMKVQFENIENNVAKANSANEKRLDGMNEFRSTLKDQAATFITKAELNATRNLLIMWTIALAGLFFTWSSWNRSRLAAKADDNGKAILSGDKVEVNK